ncbi:uncharacterized protein LOC144556991 [Carex rostrata]
MHDLTLSSLYTIPPLLSKSYQVQKKLKNHQKKSQGKLKRDKITKITERKMLPGFGRSISLTLSPSRSDKSGHAASYHKRSVSLPCRSHPIISHLEEQIRDIRSWSANPDASSVWIEAGLAQIETLLTALEEFLHLCQTQEVLRCAASTDSLLDNFLLLADIYGSFVSTLVTLKPHRCEVQSAIRRADKISLSSALRSQRHSEKKISHLASCLKNVSKCQPLRLTSNALEAEITGILVEAISATAVASMDVLSGVAALSASASLTKTSNTMWLFRTLALNSLSNNMVSTKKLEELDVSIRHVESCSERVFRKLISLRVSLLNISTSL